MNRLCRIGIALSTLGGRIGLSEGPHSITPAFTLRLPRDVNPETIRIDVDIRGKSYWQMRLAAQKGTYEYAVPFRFGDTTKAFEVGDAKSLKLFIVAPGYQAIEREFHSKELKTPRTYEVVLQKQRTALLHGLLVDTRLRPIAGQTIRLEFDPGCDHVDGILNTMEIARTMTGIDGTFQFEVRLLADTDAMFHMRTYGTTFALTTDVGTLRPTDTVTGKSIFCRFEFAPQPVYPARMSVMRIVPGRISGQLGPLFLEQNELPKNLKNYLKGGNPYVDIELKVDDAGSVFVRPNEDGSFAISVPPGTHSLSLYVVRGKTSTDISIAKGIVIAEGEAIAIQIP
jgi:hypothetical protein